MSEKGDFFNSSPTGNFAGKFSTGVGKGVGKCRFQQGRRRGQREVFDGGRRQVSRTLFCSPGMSGKQPPTTVKNGGVSGGRSHPERTWDSTALYQPHRLKQIFFHNLSAFFNRFLWSFPQVVEYPVENCDKSVENTVKVKFQAVGMGMGDRSVPIYGGRNFLTGVPPRTPMGIGISRPRARPEALPPDSAMGHCPLDPGTRVRVCFQT